MIGSGPWISGAYFLFEIEGFFKSSLAAPSGGLLISNSSRSAGNNSLSAILAFRPGRFFDSGRKV